MNVKSMPTQDIHDELFRRMVENYDATVPCQHHGGCDRPAKWVAVFHGQCPSVVVCTRHKRAWVATMTEGVREGQDLACYQCHRRFFFDLDELVTFHRLDRAGG